MEHPPPQNPDGSRIRIIGSDGRPTTVTLSAGTYNVTQLIDIIRIAVRRRGQGTR